MKRVYLFLLILLGIHIFLLFNLKFTAWPEMLSYPYPPVLTFVLSIIYKLFGYRLIVIKVFTWLIILANDILIFKIVNKVVNSEQWSVISVLFYALIQPFLEGNQLWFDLAIVPSVLLGLLFFLNKKYFLSGVSLIRAAIETPFRKVKRSFF